MASNNVSKNNGWVVAASGLGINLALGVLYTWSLFKSAIEKEFGWKGGQLNDPYALCCLVFSVAMIVAGRSQDKWGPRMTASIGGLLVGGGMVLISTSSSYGLWLLGFGVLVGIGIGFAYSSATPPALKWFAPSKTGLVAGVVVAGFGLAPLYLAPSSQYALSHWGLRNAMLYFGIAFTVVICGLAQFLRNPPQGYLPAERMATTAKPNMAGDLTLQHLFRNPTFYLLWTIYAIGAGAGLMVIGSLGGMAKKSMGEHAYVAVAIMALGNAGGRIAAGVLSDKIGRRSTLLLVLVLQSALMFLAMSVTSRNDALPLIIVSVATMIGLNYGANLALFPSFAKDLWGLKNFGVNYGVLFTAWGVGGFVFPTVQQKLTSGSGGSFQSSFISAGSMLLLGAVLTLFLPTGKRTQQVK